MKNKFIAGLDIGNGYVKGSIYGTSLSEVDIPSCVAYVTRTHDVKEKHVDEEIADIFNRLDASFDSPLIPDKNRRLFGFRGLTSGSPLEEFDVYSSLSKAKQPLSAILTLGCLAGKALQDYWNDNQALPDKELNVNVRAALALPIGEYMKFRRPYADGYLETDHIVEVHNFDKVVRINIHFEDVQVVAEGQAAQKAITAKGVEFMNAMLNDIRLMGEPLEGITAEDILEATYIVGVDIGEGTTNFPVYQNGKFNPDVSMTCNKGYGAVLNSALERLKDMGYSFTTRKELQEYLNRGTKVNKDKYKKIQEIVEDEIKGFVLEVVQYFRQLLQKVGTFTEVVYVYGGGATPVKPELYAALIEASKSFNAGEILCPILYLDSRYSRKLNREGLYVIADTLAKKMSN